MRKIAYAALLSLPLVPLSAHAMFSCEGSLKRESFAAERTQLQKELQKNILDYRKLETQKATNPQVETQLRSIMGKINEQKVKFKSLDSKHFPNTPVTAFGAACNDMRWLDEAKAKLVEKPEHLGKHWYVWLDKTSRKPMAALERASFDVMAE